MYKGIALHLRAAIIAVFSVNEAPISEIDGGNVADAHERESRRRARDCAKRRSPVGAADDPVENALLAMCANCESDRLFN